MINYNINDKGRNNNTGLPDAELDSIARVLYSSIIEYCNSEKGKKIMSNGKNKDNLILKIKKLWLRCNHRSILYEVLDRKRR